MGISPGRRRQPTLLTEFLPASVFRHQTIRQELKLSLSRIDDNGYYDIVTKRMKTLLYHTNVTKAYRRSALTVNGKEEVAELDGGTGGPVENAINAVLVKGFAS